MTIDEMYKRGDINTIARNACIRNRITTFSDLELHYLECKTFKNLKSCGDKTNSELIKLYTKYKQVIDEQEASRIVDLGKSELNLDAIVTDLDEVIKTTIGNATVQELEKKLKNHWREKS